MLRRFYPVKCIMRKAPLRKDLCRETMARKSIQRCHDWALRLVFRVHFPHAQILHQSRHYAFKNPQADSLQCQTGDRNECRSTLPNIYIYIYVFIYFEGTGVCVTPASVFCDARCCKVNLEKRLAILDHVPGNRSRQRILELTNSTPRNPTSHCKQLRIISNGSPSSQRSPNMRRMGYIHRIQR